jgi:hypothetical protein
MNQKLAYFLSLLIFCVLISSCSVQKKLYNRGWHFESLFQTNKSSKEKNATKKLAVKKNKRISNNKSEYLVQSNDLRDSFFNYYSVMPVLHTIPSTYRTDKTKEIKQNLTKFKRSSSKAIHSNRLKNLNSQPKEKKKKINKKGFIYLTIGLIFGLLGYIVFKIGGYLSFWVFLPLILLMYLFLMIGFGVMFKSYIKSKIIKNKKNNFTNKIKNLFKKKKGNEKARNKLAVIGVILGLFGLLFNILFGFAFLLDFFGLVFSLISFYRTSSDKRSGLGLSILGIAIFLITFLLQIL